MARENWRTSGRPAICSNDEDYELQTVLAGKVLGQRTGWTAAQYIPTGQLTPILVEHMPDYASYFVYFGSRTSQPARPRAFIDLAMERLTSNQKYGLSSKELLRGQREVRR